MYKELDIITAKVTKEERLQAPHHMIDIVDPLVNYTVIDFRNRALSIVSFHCLKSKCTMCVFISPWRIYASYQTCFFLFIFATSFNFDAERDILEILTTHLRIRNCNLNTIKCVFLLLSNFRKFTFFKYFGKSWYFFGEKWGFVFKFKGGKFI